MLIHATMTPDHNACIIMTTYPNDGRSLKRLILALVKSGAASCVQRLNYMKSYYLWEGKLRQTEEKLLLIKTTDKKKAQALQMLRKQHPYDVPEIMILRPDEVDKTYLAWMQGKHTTS